MARIRTVKPELWMSPQVMNLAHSARLMFVGLITQADDQGRGLADLRRLKAAIFPGDDITSINVGEWLKQCAAEELVILYSATPHGDLYQLPSWHSHQSIQKPSPSNYPPPTGYLLDKYRNSTVELPEDYSGKGEERNGKEQGTEGKGEAPAVAGLDVDAWTAWTVYRKQIGKPVKPASIPAAQRKLVAHGTSQAAVVEQSIANGWQGLFPLKHNGHDHAKPATSRFDKLRGQR